MLYDERLAVSQLTARTTFWAGFERLAEAGVQLSDEPFFRQMLLAMYRYSICQDMLKVGGGPGRPSPPPSRCR